MNANASVERAPAAGSMLRVLAFAFFAIVLLRTAWISDSAYLTLRTIDHAVHGAGLTWNVQERVQAFDDPLWLLLLFAIRLVVHQNLYFLTIGVSFALSLFTFWVFIWRARGEWVTLFVAVVLALSPVFVTFSTSGLDDPLLHALAAVAAVVFISGADDASTRFPGAVLLGLLVLADWRTSALVGPALAVTLRRTGWMTRVGTIAIVLAPLVLWRAWAFWYYGAWASNGRIADWIGGLAWRDRLDVGRQFLSGTISFDPLAAAVVLCGVLAGVSKGARGRALAAGIILYVFAIVASGGSAMVGRSLTPAIVVAMVLLLSIRFAERPRVAAVATLAAMALAFAGGERTFAADARYGYNFRPTSRSHDGRAEDYQATGLLLEARGRRAPDDPETDRARTLAAGGNMAGISSKPGFFSAGGGLAMAVIDPKGVVDPLMARLPPLVGPRWSWGWLRRTPDAYVNVLAGHVPVLPDASLEGLRERLTFVTADPLAAHGRLGAILALNHTTAIALAGSSYGPVVMDVGSSGTLADAHTLLEGGIELKLPAPAPVGSLDVVASQSYDLQVDVLDGAAVVRSVVAPRADWQAAGTGLRHVALTASAATAVLIRCGRGIGPCVVEHARIQP